MSSLSEPQPSRGTLAEHVNAHQSPKECISCRIVGTATFAGVGTYALYQSRAAAPGTPTQKRLVGGLGVGGSLLPVYC